MHTAATTHYIGVPDAIVRDIAERLVSQLVNRDKREIGARRFN